MAKDLLIELGSEELPASFIGPALTDLVNSLSTSLKELVLEHGHIRTYGTPRRLTVLIPGLQEQQADRTVEVLGPPVKASFDADGVAKTPAIKFAETNKIAVTELQRKQTPKGEYLFTLVHEKGQATHTLLPAIVDKAMAAIQFRKAMRWGHELVKWARPLQWIVALYGAEVVPVSFGLVHSARTTWGHRFLDPDPILLDTPMGYADVLEKAHVLADIDARRERVQTEAAKAAATVGGRILPDAGLLDTVTNLVEWPSAVLGSFDADYLQLPPEVLVSEMKSHQKYFSVLDDAGKLMPYFVAISNTPVKHLEVSRNGYQRVLRSRLADARFFFDEDQKRPLAQRVDDLKKVMFQQQLGTSYEKLERFRTLAQDLAAWTGKGDPKVIERAATLCKADLVTGMVGEFPELQGIMGREYARKQGESDEVALAIDEHYLPRNASDRTPTHDAGALIGIADRLDSVVGLIGIGKKPTAATDQYGVRRQTIAVQRLILDRGYRVSLGQAVDRALVLLGSKVADPKKTRAETLDFFRDRLKNEWVESHKADVVEAVLSAGFDDIVATFQRLEALSKLVKQPGFDPLAVAFKRVVNIVQKQAAGVAKGDVDAELFAEEAERALWRSFLGLRSKVDAAAAAGDFDLALQEITSLKPAVDLFFDKVLVMAEDSRVKDNRVRMLREIGDMFNRVADFSQISSQAQA